MLTARGQSSRNQKQQILFLGANFKKKKVSSCRNWSMHSVCPVCARPWVWFPKWEEKVRLKHLKHSQLTQRSQHPSTLRATREMKDFPTAGQEFIWGQQFSLEVLTPYNMMVIFNTECLWNIIGKKNSVPILEKGEEEGRKGGKKSQIIIKIISPL